MNTTTTLADASRHAGAALVSAPLAAERSASSSRDSHRSSSRGLAALLIVTAALSFAPVAILAPAIGWPASLGKPAAEQLVAIAAKPDAVALGYGVYLLYSMLIAPAMIGLAAHVCGGLARPLAASAAAFATLSALARAIGILRWLTVMPALAVAHSRGDAPTRAQIEALFNALTAYGGGIGEVLGVSLFMAASVGCLSVAAWRHASLPAGLAAAGAIVALMLAALAAPILRLPPVMSVALAVTALSLWMLAVGVWLAWPRRVLDLPGVQSR
jgi:Domain of unknown function (DUF4386)